MCVGMAILAPHPPVAEGRSVGAVGRIAKFFLTAAATVGKNITPRTAAVEYINDSGAGCTICSSRALEQPGAPPSLIQKYVGDAVIPIPLFVFS